MDDNGDVSTHVIELLSGGSAHIDAVSAIGKFPVDKMNERPGGSPHSGWQLLEHIRIAQWDILEFCRNPKHVSPEFPDGYWPAADGTPETWDASADAVADDLRAMRELVTDPSTDLFAPIAHGEGQTILREALLVADHNAYHLGQLMLVAKMLGAE
jgi:hypothetical protein